MLSAFSALSALTNIEIIARCTAATERECATELGRQAAGPLGAGVARVANKLEAYLNTTAGAAVFDQLWETNRAALPDIAAELEGWAAGAGIELRDLKAAALSTELAWFARKAGLNVTAGKSCSDYHALSPTLQAWVHNEDGLSSDVDETFMIDANVSGVRRIAFVYAHDAGLGGWAWGLNSHGVAQSVNALFPANMTVGIATAFHARHVAGATSLDDAIRRACSLSPAGGQHLNVGSIHASAQAMIEVSPEGCDVRTLSPAAVGDASTVGYHANLYESRKLKGLDADPLAPSSVHRMRRMAEFASPTSTGQLEQIISDTKDRAYPIHRTPRPTDEIETLNSVLFDVAGRTISVWGTEAPAAADKPALRIDWRSMEMHAGAVEE